MSTLELAEARIEQEQRVIEQMIRIYCRGMKHAGSKKDGRAGSETIGGTDGATDRERKGSVAHDGLCPDCRELASYARERNARCPRLEDRSFCQFCPVHCYKPEMRARIAEVMRYAGPRMLWHNPAYALKHLRELRRHRRNTEA
ncbi:MAG: nitrous oxide-stimulated promoter family protein [Coriobacteriales bacterium]|jgi:hypothetical protein|nr:nitrous oxide-stimulated promoter family protein [Coriobacteriales bacterium]